MSKCAASVRLVFALGACEDCGVRRLCLAAAMDDETLAFLGRIVKHRGPLAKGAFIFRAGAPFRSLYALQSGAAKSYGITRNGEEQITGFHLTGELVGMDAIGAAQHTSSAVALSDNTRVCELPFAHLRAIAERVPALQDELLYLLGSALRRDEDVLMLVRRLRAEERVLSFVRSLCERLSRGCGPLQEVPLPMSREDMANYLGLAPETLSRALRRLRADRLIDVGPRSIRILDVHARPDADRA